MTNYTSLSFFLLHNYNIHLITLIILLSASVSYCDNTNFSACSIPFSCGNLRVSYPFWGDNRPKFCGIPDLKLTCQQDQNQQADTIIDSVDQGYAPLIVVQIDTPSHTMIVNQSRLFNRCHERRRIMKLNSSLKQNITTGYEQIHLFYGCNTHCTSKYQYNCSESNDVDGNNGTAGTAHYFGNESDDIISNKSRSCSCKNNISFTVDKRVLHDLSRSANASLHSLLRKWPIYQLRYTANFDACSKCEHSGGRCGSPEDGSSDQFLCHCRDGTHQSLVCPPEPDKTTDRHKRLEITLILGVGGGVFLLVAVITIWCCMKKKNRSKFVDHSASFDCSASELEKGSRYYSVPLFSYRELAEATRNFDQELGSGGFGIVYHGKLKDGREVAVKRLYEKNYKRLEQFMNEVHILTRLRHHNLVSLYGCTSQYCRELLLVYEYVQNGTVADHLFCKKTDSESSLLPWPIRLRIAIETATALSYLHASDIIHRDIKTNNILLDSNFSVKVADFGLSRLFPTDVSHVSTAPQGTPGYLDPEYHQCYQLTDKSDVYSFGVVLVELISSLPAIDMNRHRHEINLSNYAVNRIQRYAFDKLVDPQLGFATDFKVRRMTTSVAELAFQCLQHDKEFRPSMDEVLEGLKKIESADYDALLRAENLDKMAVQEVVGLHSRNLQPPPSPTEDDHVQLLRNQPLQPPSPISVMDKWVSISTTPNTSK